MIVPEGIPLESMVVAPGIENHHKISPWIDEKIWGHRIYPQSPWLIFLEFLTVAEYFHREGQLLVEPDGHYPLLFKPYQRMYLRNILWNNEMTKSIQETVQDSNNAWEMWLAAMDKKAKGGVFNFNYLRSRFKTYHEFASLVTMLQHDAAVESETNKRWSSRFLFPFDFKEQRSTLLH